MMQGREAGSNPTTGPKRFSFADTKRKEENSPRDQYHYKPSNDNSLGLDLNSVWSIERNMKVGSSSRQKVQLGLSTSTQPPSHNFYSRYTNSGKESRRPPSVPGRNPPRYPDSHSGHRYPDNHSGHIDIRTGQPDRYGSANGPNVNSGPDRSSAGLQSRSPDSFGRNSSGGGRFAGERGSYDPLGDDFW